jgi:hypothetical protein
LDLYFRGAQLIRRRVFDIDGGGYERVWPDGRRNTTLVVHCIEQGQVSDQPDLVQLNSKGEVVGDTRRDRIKATINLSQLSVYHGSDPTARRMLESFDAAIRYPGNELVYLYEIWDALQTKFRGNKKGLKALGISRPNRSRLTNLANREPLNQGRHRGRFDTLREATVGELAEARKIATEMIEKFMLYLDDR